MVTTPATLAITPFLERLMLISLTALFALVMPQIVRSIAILFGSFGLVAMLTLIVLSLATGWLADGRRVQYRHTLAIATGVAQSRCSGRHGDCVKVPCRRGRRGRIVTVRFLVATVAGEFFKQAAPQPASWSR